MLALIRKLGSVVFRAACAPVLSLGKNAARGGPFTWALHALLLVGVLAGLWWAGRWLELEKLVHAPSRVLREGWLPLLFLLAYGLAWVGLWTWRALTAPDAASPFPDIDHCWRQAAANLHRRGVDLSELPVILLLGQPAGRESELLAALELTPTFGPTPSSSDAPLRVFADDHALYLLCHDVSLTSVCAQRIAEERIIRKGRPRHAASAPLEASMPVALRAGAAGVATAVAEPRPAQQEFAHAGEFGSEDFDPFTSGVDDRPPSDNPRPLVTWEEAELCHARLDHLTRLVARDREPLPAVTGVALLLPADGLLDDRSATALAEAVEQDLDGLTAGVGAACPVLTIFTDLQHTPGCGELLHTLSADRKRRQFGVEIPAEPTDGGDSLRDALRTLTQEMPAVLCQHLYQIDGDPAVTRQSLHDNAALYRFEQALYEQGERALNVLRRGLSGELARLPLVGCYLVATGDAAGGSQAFGAGLLQKLTSPATPTAWTDEALATDAHHHRLTRWGYTSLAAAVVLTACGLIAP